MELTLKNIIIRGEKNMVFASIDVRYGYDGDMYADTLRLNFDPSKRETYLTVTCANPGIGAVAEKVASFIASFMKGVDPTENPLPLLFEAMKNRLSLTYDPSAVESILQR